MTIVYVHSSHYPVGVIQTPLSSSLYVDGVILEFSDFMLPAILRNLALTFCSVLPECGITCTQCNKPMDLGYWNDRGSTYKQPHVLHNIDKVFLLVSAVYTS